MTFDQWADDIAARVSQALPDVFVKRKVDDLYRLILADRECQMHATSDATATFVALRRDRGTTTCPLSIHVAIARENEDDVARRIIGWLSSRISSPADMTA